MRAFKHSGWVAVFVLSVLGGVLLARAATIPQVWFAAGVVAKLIDAAGTVISELPVANTGGASGSWAPAMSAAQKSLAAKIELSGLGGAADAVTVLGVPVAPATDGGHLPAPTAAGTTDTITLYTQTSGCPSMHSFGPAEICVIAGDIVAEYNGGGETCVGSYGGGVRYVYSVVSCSGNSYTVRTHDNSNNGDSDSTTTATAVDSCPSGYTGPPCVLSNARAVAADGKLDVARDGNTYTYEGGDADRDLSGQIKGSVSGSTVSVAGTDANGVPFQMKITANDSGTEIKKQVQTYTKSGVPTVVESTLQLDTEGRAVSLQQSTASGQVVPTSIGAQTATVTTPGGADAPSEQSPCEPGAAGEVNCEATQQGVLTALTNTKGDPPELKGEKGGSDILDALKPSSLTALLAWTFPSHTSECPTLVLDVFGTTVVGDSHCTLLETFRSTFSVMFIAGWVLLAVFIVLGA